MEHNHRLLVNKGKYLAQLLRHDKEAFEQGKIDKHGWRQVQEILTLGYTQELLDEIVETNNKKRFEYNEDKTLIRARQGHSIDVDVDLKEMVPPEILYHGTAKHFLPSIFSKGLIPGNRLHVHLSVDEDTATKVGSRHGEPFVIPVDTKRMYEDGYKFYKSNNGVWLTNHVPTDYFVF